MNKPIVSIVVAMSRFHRAIGKNGRLLWHIPADMKRFKALTRDHPVIMGRKTFESILGYLGKPLPQRTNIVVTTNKRYRAPKGVVIVHTVTEALAYAQKEDMEIFIGGGSEIYKEVLPLTDRLYLTLIDDEPEADSFFPDYSMFNKKTHEENHEYEGLRYSWVTLEKT